MLVLVSLVMTGCALPSLSSFPSLSRAPEPDVGPSKGRYQVGKPYQIKGNWYYPQEDFTYDAQGVASWYGAQFHGRLTANGEIFDRRGLTAAHKTLQLPTLVEVTNLENGRQVVLRVNDRGPFVDDRLIDVSERAAEILGFRKAGLAMVRVRVLADESRALARVMGRQTPDIARPVETPAQVAVIGQAQAAPAAAPPADSATNAQAAMAVVTPLAQPTEPPAATPADPPGRRPLGASVAPTPSANAVGPDSVFVQIGSFTDEGRAQYVAQQFLGIAPVDVYPAIVSGQQYYRVRLGPYEDRNAGRNARSLAVEMNYLEAQIVAP
ncbi:MAG: septal ring lytic transglycosylase RlpA family protein [Pseudomonadota bacterium]